MRGEFGVYMLTGPATFAMVLLYDDIDRIESCFEIRGPSICLIILPYPWTRAAEFGDNGACFVFFLLEAIKVICFPRALSSYSFLDLKPMAGVLGTYIGDNIIFIGLLSN